MAESNPVATLVPIILILAAIPAALFLWNLWFYREPLLPDGNKRRSVSVLIPARNEEQTIEAAVRSALGSRYVDLEVIVLDDSSQDNTAAVVSTIAAEDARVHLATAPPLPAGWCGKQWACNTLGSLATHDLFCFLDADVRVQPDGLARMLRTREKLNAALLSGFPWQRTETLAEQLLLPLMHFLLLGFLPMVGMRRTKIASFGAGCGQIFIAERAGYEKTGGHAAIKDSRHDGITLPRAFRQAGLHTDICDATHVAECRMYGSAEQVFYGLLKNATEGLAAPGRIVPFSMWLLLGQVLPLPLLGHVLYHGGVSRRTVFELIAAVLLAYGPRTICAIKYKQSWIGVLLHPLGVFTLVVIQWIALIRSFVGVPNTWKGRTYSRSTT